LQDFTKVKAKITKQNIKDLVWTKSETLKLLWMISTGYLVNNGINEGPSGTKKSTIIYPSSSKSGYVFNVNEYLRGKSAYTDETYFAFGCS
jgi:hypothetical protein